MNNYVPGEATRNAMSDEEIARFNELQDAREEAYSAAAGPCRAVPWRRFPRLKRVRPKVNITGKFWRIGASGRMESQSPAGWVECLCIVETLADIERLNTLLHGTRVEVER